MLEYPLEDPSDLAPYKLTWIEELPETNVALNLGHYFKIDLAEEVKTTEIKIQLDRKKLRGIDFNTLQLIRVNTDNIS